MSPDQLTALLNTALSEHLAAARCSLNAVLSSAVS